MRAWRETVGPFLLCDGALGVMLPTRERAVGTVRRGKGTHMPYRHAHWWILGLLPLIGIAFMPNYWSVFTTAPMGFHLHGMTALAWLLLLAWQSWSIHRGRRAAHRQSGRLSLILFPLFLAGGTGLFFGMAQKMVEGSEFHLLYGAQLAWFDFAGVGMMAYFFHEALRHRRRVSLHSAYMLATIIPLLPPILGRLSGIPLGVRGPGTFELLYPGFIFSALAAAAIALVVARGRGADGRPWLIAALISVLSAVAFVTVGESAAWRSIFAWMAGLPTAPFILASAAAGVLIAWSGWTLGRRSRGFDGALPA